MIYSITLDWEIVLICTLKIHYKKFYYSVSSGFDIFTHASLYGEKKKNEAQSSGKCMSLCVWINKFSLDGASEVVDWAPTTSC